MVIDLRSTAMHQTRGVDDVSAKGQTDRLMTKTDSENRDLRPELADNFDTHTRVLGTTGARRNEDPLRSHGPDLIDGKGVVPVDDDIRAQPSKKLDEVVGE